MLKDITIGQYIAAKGPVHSLNAAVKILLTIAYMAGLFMIHGMVSYILYGLLTFAVVLLTKIPVKTFLRGLRPMRFIIIFTAAVNILFTKGTAVFSIPLVFTSLPISREGLVLALTITVRLIFLVIGSSALTLTTPPLALTDGIERLLKPFGKLGLPYAELAMMMSIAIRFIPTLADEAEKIKSAQLSRGADFASGGLIRRSRAMLPMLIPLFVSAFRRADELAEAMDSRCYGCGIKRTRLHPSKISRFDLLSSLIFILCLAAIIAYQLIIGN